MSSVWRGWGMVVGMLLGFAWAPGVQAQVTTDIAGTLLDAVTVTGASTVEVVGHRAVRLVFDIDMSPPMSATVDVEELIAGGSYRQVAQTTTSGHLSVDNPIGRYRVNVTICSSCTVTVVYEWRKP